jgi:hypothetical protein
VHVKVPTELFVTVTAAMQVDDPLKEREREDETDIV